MRRKLDRFLHNQEAHNVIERGKYWYPRIKGKWEDYFENSKPVVLELACGKGEYTVGLAKNRPEINVVGVDIKGDRIARGSKNAIKESLKNAAFLRTGIQYLEEFFEPEAIEEIWLIHPDPQPRGKEEKKRLTNLNFLKLYYQLLRNGGLFLLKTDSAFLYDYSLEALEKSELFDILDKTDNLYSSRLNSEHFGIETYYENIWRNKGNKIHYIKCKKRPPGLT